MARIESPNSRYYDNAPRWMRASVAGFALLGIGYLVGRNMFMDQPIQECTSERTGLSGRPSLSLVDENNFRVQATRTTTLRYSQQELNRGLSVHEAQALWDRTKVTCTQEFIDNNPHFRIFFQ